MKKKILIILLSVVCCFALAFGFTACKKPSGDSDTTQQPPSGDSGTTQQPPTVEVIEFTLSASSLDLEEGDGATLTAIVKPDNATNKTVEWQSSNENVVAVNDGRVTAVKEGTAKIIATCGAKSAECSVKVTKKPLLTFKTLQAGEDDTVYGKVANATTDFSFINEVTANNGATFTVASDKACKDTIPSKTVDLKEGDNVFYILAERGDEIKLFTVTLRRRPIYAVTFNTAGGTAVATQQVEEDEFAQTQPTTRVGYTFANWSYDFSKPILNDEAITAAWTANTYKVSFDVNGGEELQENTQQVTYDQNYTLPTATRTGYTFAGWYDGEQKIVNGIWQFIEDKSLNAKWDINYYDFSVTSNISAGGILACTNSAIYEFDTEILLNCQPNLGYTFLGWYENDELITPELNYEFKLIGNISITAMFACYQELRDFNFYYDNDEKCIITGVADRQIKEITIPKYAQLLNYDIFNSAVKLEKINVENGSALYSGFEGILYSKDFKNILYCPKNIESIIIHENITQLNERQFANLTNLKYVELNDKIVTIESYVFYGCSNLGTVKLGNNVRTVYVTAFDGCTKLSELEHSFNVNSWNCNIEYDIRLCDGKSWESRLDVRFTVDNIKGKCSNYISYLRRYSSKGWFFERGTRIDTSFTGRIKNTSALPIKI